MRIGIDLDNTIICYDRIFHKIAVERGLITEAFTPEKQTIRDHIRTLPDGETAWTALQAEVYGPRLSDAEAFPDVFDVMRKWHGQGHELFIVSHKTRYAAADIEETCDLRLAALEWLSNNRIVDHAQAPVPAGNVYFEDARPAKCRRIGTLGCEVFIDDLTEVFLEDTYPHHVRGILFQADKVPGLPDTLVTAASWRDVADAVI